jgi:hypothetical protein
LVARESLAAAEKTQKRIAVTQKYRRKRLSGRTEVHPTCVNSIVTPAVIEQDPGEWTRTRRNPEQRFETQLSTGDHNGSRSDWS